MRRFIWVLVPVLLLGGCRAEILQHDQMAIRESLLEMYQDEVMDNLIRTKLMLPVIEVDYRTMTGTISSYSKANASYSREGDTNIFTGASGNTPLHSVKSIPIFGGEQDETTQLTLTGEPVCDETVYAAYEEYLYGPEQEKPEATSRPGGELPTTAPVTGEEKQAGRAVSIEQAQAQPNSYYTVMLKMPEHPLPPPEVVPQGRLLCSDTKPADGTYHLAKEFDGKWYYIPPDSAMAFFKLYKRVVLARQPYGTSSQNLGDELQLFRLNQLQQ
jgi:hypothetical protein